MASLWQAVKNDIMTNGNIKWDAVLYLLSAPVGLMACIASIKGGLEVLKDPSKFHMAPLWIALSSCLIFLSKLPYMMDKPLARTIFIMNCIFWSIATIILYLAYRKHEKLKKIDKNLDD